MKKVSLLKKSIVLAAFLTAALLVGCGKPASHSELAQYQDQSVVRIFEKGSEAPTAAPVTLTRSGVEVTPQELDKMLRFLDQNGQHFNIAPDIASLTFKANPESSKRSVRLTQTIQGIPIEGAELALIFTEEGQLKAVNSSIVQNQNIDATPDLDEASARVLLKNYLLERYNFTASEASLAAVEATLYFTPYTKDELVLVWRFEGVVQTGDEPTLKVILIDIGAQGAFTGIVMKDVPIGSQVVPSIRVYNASLVPIIPTPIYMGVHVLENGEKTKDAARLERIGIRAVTEQATAAHSNFTKITEFYLSKMKRSSYDNKGSRVDALVEFQKYSFGDILGFKQNAAWVPQLKSFIFGAGGDKLGDFPKSLDVVGHEFTHAVVSYSSNLTYEKQSGALNEHFADVMGEIIQQTYETNIPLFLIGEGTLRGEYAQRARALRDMAEPAKGLMPQPGHLNEISEEFGPDCKPGQENDLCGVHIISGIPNRAAVKIIQHLGIESSAKLFYSVMVDRLRSSSNFADYKNQMLDECMATLAERDCAVVLDALKMVGL